MPPKRARRRTSSGCKVRKRSSYKKFKVASNEDDVPLKNIQSTMVSKATIAARKSVAKINAAGHVSKKAETILKCDEQQKSSYLTRARSEQSKVAKNATTTDIKKAEDTTIKDTETDGLIVAKNQASISKQETQLEVSMGEDVVIHVEIERVEPQVIAISKEECFNATNFFTPKKYSDIEFMSMSIDIEDLESTTIAKYPLKTPAACRSKKLSIPCSPPKVSKMQTSSPAALLTSCLLQPTTHTPFEYQLEVMSYFRERELNGRPKPCYLKLQPQIDRAARAFLVDWLVIAAKERNLDTETLFNAVSYLDRLLSVLVIARVKLRIVGISCLHIAAKFEEMRPRKLEKFARIGNVESDVREILKMEEIILGALSFNLRQPTVYTFVSAFAMATKMSNVLTDLTVYICELSLLESEPYSQFLPSEIAAAAHALARYLLAYEIWSAPLEVVTTYRLEQLKQIFLCLSKTHASASKILPRAIQLKYLDISHGEVASIESEIIHEAVFDNFVDIYYSHKRY